MILQRRNGGISLLEVIIAATILFTLTSVLLQGLRGSQREDLMAAESLEYLFALQSCMETLRAMNPNQLPVTGEKTGLIEYSRLLLQAGLQKLDLKPEIAQNIVIDVETDGYVKTIYLKYVSSRIKRKDVFLVSSVSLSL